MAATQEQLKQVIGETFSPNIQLRKKAEENLANLQKTGGHASLVLQLVASSDGVDENVRQAAAVYFKNTVKKGWKAEDAAENGILIEASERHNIKTHLVQLMCTTPPLIQVQLSESISLIAESDYPASWENLLPELVQKFNNPDQEVVNGVLKTANSIFKSFRYVERTDDLYRKIIYTLEGIQAPLLGLLKQTSQAIQALHNNPLKLVPLFETLRIICRIAYSLNYQDLPEYFEDHMGDWMEEFAKFLQPNIFPILIDPDEETEPSPIDKVQAAIIVILSHYSSKDEEVFIETYLPQFMSLIWHLLLNVSNQTKQDILATTSIRFLTGLVAKPMHHHLFHNEDTLRQIVLRIVIPNLYFREADEERFEDDPHEFMVTEVEGSDSETRRKCSQDCLKALCRQFEPTTAICVQHIQSMIAEDQNGNNWKAKDAAINLMMGVAIRAETSSRGVSRVNLEANVPEFFQNQILPELQDTNHTRRPVVKATAIKFVASFRNQFTTEQLVMLFPLLINQLSSPIIVVHTFSAYAIERILSTKDDNGRLKVGGAQLMPFLEPLFTGLFAIVCNAEWNENDYVMKCVTKALAIVGNDVLAVTEIVITKLTETLGRIAKNPRNPQFNHYLFESIAVLIRNVCRQDANATASFEKLLFEPFNIVLQMQVEEFTPYVFQILAQLLEYRPSSSGLGESYEQLFPPLMTAGLWVRGKVPALARLIQAYLRQAGPALAAHVRPILGIFQQLLSSRATEEHSFMVLNAAILYFPQEAMKDYITTVFNLLFMRLQKARTAKYLAQVSNFFSIFVGRYGAEQFVAVIEGIQRGMIYMIVKDVWAHHVLNTPPVQRTQAKIQVVGLTKLLCDSSVLLVGGNGDMAWAAGTVATVKLIGSPTFKDTNVVADLAVDEKIDISFDSEFSQLQFARQPVDDPFPEVSDPVLNFCQSLSRLSAQQPGRLGPLIQQAIGDDGKLLAGFQLLIQSNAISLA